MEFNRPRVLVPAKQLGRYQHWVEPDSSLNPGEAEIYASERQATSPTL